MRPEVLILDEPTAGLDPAGRENLMANIRDYHRNKGKTIILVSHSMDEIARNVDRILVLKNAHVLMQGTPAEVFARGADFDSGNIFQKAKALVPILVPLFISAFRRADELATAMECRCYHGGEGRTKLHVLKYQRRDYVALAGGAVILALVVVLRRLGA